MPNKKIEISPDTPITKDDLMTKIRAELDKEFPTDTIANNGKVKVSVENVSQGL